MGQKLTLQQLNQMDRSAFVELLGSVFEHSPWVAEGAYNLLPITSVEDLQQKMTSVMNHANEEKQLALIRAHPELAGKEAQSDALTRESKNEQASAGLNHCSTEELAHLRQLNRQYRDRFGFPFIIAVKQLTRHDILEQLQQRLNHSAQDEFNASLQQIIKIASFRLHDLVTD